MKRNSKIFEFSIDKLKKIVYNEIPKLNKIHNQKSIKGGCIMKYSNIYNHELIKLQELLRKYEEYVVKENQKDIIEHISNKETACILYESTMRDRKAIHGLISDIEEILEERGA